jgi:hypothetical protein
MLREKLRSSDAALWVYGEFIVRPFCDHLMLWVSEYLDLPPTGQSRALKWRGFF